MLLNEFKGFSTQSKEESIPHLQVEGDIPVWLAGDFISNGPAQFNIESLHFNHWLDGFAMLKKFSFKAGQVQFQNKFLHSKQFTRSNQLKRLNTNEFATYASTSFLGRIKNSIQELLTGNQYDNCNVNIVKVASHFIAMTESNHVIEFQSENLTTTGTFTFADNMRWHLGTAHPKIDFSSGEIINVAIEIGQQIKYHVYKILPNTTQRILIQTYLSDRLFYMHSFSVTKNYVILFKSPLTVNKYQLMLGLPFNHTLFLKQNTPSYFVIIDKRNHKIHEIETPPFVCLHSINAYENKKEIILDLICYQTMNPYQNLYLSNLQKTHPHIIAGAIQRFIINLDAKHCSSDALTEMKHEFPNIHPQLNGEYYQYLYCNSLEGQECKFLNSIQKINMATGKIQIWKKDQYYPGEPVFVASNNPASEDDGVLLSIIYNNANQCSLLAIIDAKTMQEIAEVHLNFYLPLGLHGNFYQ